MHRWRRWLPRVLVESALIIFSVLLAFVLNDWREDRARADRASVALASIRAELEANRIQVDTTRRYHRALADSMFRLAAAGVPEISYSLYPKGLIRIPDVTAGAWQSAQSTGATTDMPHRTTLSLARAYERQAEYLRWRDAVIQNVQNHMLDEGVEVINREYSHVAGSISDVAHWERRVVERYDSALASLPR